MAIFCASVLTYWFSAPPFSGKPLAGTPDTLPLRFSKSHQLHQQDDFLKGR
jgi:hypothetical protein